MEFSKIRYDGAEVKLDYTEMFIPKLGAAETKRVVQTKGKDPTPAFKRALQAFTGYVLWTISAPPDWQDRLEVRSVSIKRPDDEPRGINVHANLTCKRARNGVVAINTPYMSEPPSGYAGESKSFLTSEVMGFVDTLEQEATNYLNGERGEQTSLALGTFETTRAADDRMASAEVASTRKPKGKGKKGETQKPGVGLVVNPDGEPPLDDDGIRQLLLTVERDVKVDAINGWTASERAAAVRWGKYQQRVLTKSVKPEEDVIAEPECVKASEDKPLSADNWTEPNPPRVSDEGAEEIANAARG